MWIKIKYYKYIDKGIQKWIPFFISIPGVEPEQITILFGWAKHYLRDDHPVILEKKVK